MSRNTAAKPTSSSGNHRANSPSLRNIDILTIHTHTMLLCVNALGQHCSVALLKGNSASSDKWEKTVALLQMDQFF